MSLTYSLHQPNQALPRATIVVAVILIHVAAFIALNNGFAPWSSVLKPSVFHWVDFKPDPPKPAVIPVPQTPRELVNTSFVPRLPDLPQPAIKIGPDKIPPKLQDDSRIGDQTTQPVVPPPSRVAVLYRVDPSYPASAERAGNEGVVLLEARIDAFGRVIDANVIRSSGFNQLDAAALKAVKQWRFAPVSGGARVRVPIRFQLNAFR